MVWEEYFSSITHFQALWKLPLVMALRREHSLPLLSPRALLPPTLSRHTAPQGLLGLQMHRADLLLSSLP